MQESENPFADLHTEEARVLPPDYSLKKIIGEGVDIKQIFSSENVEKAQKVINEHKDNFLEWVMKDMASVEALYLQAASAPANSDATVQAIAKSAFIIKSQAGTFGFTLATRVAKSLDDFCTRHASPTPEHIRVIRKHLDALHVIFQQHITGDGGQMGTDLTTGLFKLVEKYRAQ